MPLGVFLTSQLSAAATCARSSSSRCWSAPSAWASRSRCFMNPSEGLINQALGVLGIPGPAWLTDPNLALFSIAIVDIWKGVGLATLIYLAGIVAIPQEYSEAARVDGGGGVKNFWYITLSAVVARDIDGHHPVADRRPALVRPDLDDDAWRSRLLIRRPGIGDVQAVPVGLLGPLDGGKRGALPPRHGDHPPDQRAAQPQGGGAMRRTRRYGGGHHRDHRLDRGLHGPVRLHPAHGGEDPAGVVASRLHLAHRMAAVGQHR